MIVRVLRVLGIVAVAVCYAFGAPVEMDLDRQTPVPSGSEIPITDFFRPAYMSSPKINLAGSHVAALVTGGSEKPQLMVIDLEKGERDIVSGRSDQMVYTHQWLGNEHISFKISADKRADMGLMVVRLKKLKKPYPIFQYGGTQIVGFSPDDPLKPLVLVRGGMSARSTGLYRLNAKLDTGPLIALSRNYTANQDWERVTESNQRHILKNFPKPKGGENTNFVTDALGNLMMSYSIESGKVFAHLWDGADWNPSSVDLDEVRVLGVGDQWGEMIATREVFEGERAEVRFLDMSTGEWGAPLLSDDEYDFVGGFYRDPGTLKVVGAMYHRDGPAVEWFDEDYAKLQRTLDNAFPKRVVRIAGADENGDNLVVRVFGDRLPSEYYLVNLKNKSIDLIAKSRPWIDPERMRPMNIIQFKTAEGLELDAYVTMPEGASKENPPPLLVIPHGGPWARDYWGFDPEAQFWASRGYAVLQPNYRGSPGYDWKFPLEGRYDFLKMHDDVTRATKTLIRSGYADPNRIAIMGASFGGYLSLSGVAHEPELYQCAVSFAGVFDFEAVLNAARRGFEREKYEILARRLGDPKKQKEKFDRISPVRYVDQIEVPVFVAHGKDDTTALVGESKRLIRELKEHDVEHESLFLSNEGHGTAELANRVELITRMEAFLQKHL